MSVTSNTLLHFRITLARAGAAVPVHERPCQSTSGQCMGGRAEARERTQSVTSNPPLQVQTRSVFTPARSPLARRPKMYNASDEAHSSRGVATKTFPVSP